MNIIVRIILIPCLLTVLNAGSESSLFSLVQSNLSKYRHSISKDDFSFQNGIISLELDGRRTNIKSQFLLGFYSIGMILQRTDVYCREIEIVIRYEMKVSRKVTARATADKVLKLSQGRLRPAQFLIFTDY